jgi:hypothetical protein
MILVFSDEDRAKRREVLSRGLIANLERKYYQTGNKKYLHFLKGLGVDVDYDVSDDADRKENQ